MIAGRKHTPEVKFLSWLCSAEGYAGFVLCSPGIPISRRRFGRRKDTGYVRVCMEAPGLTMNNRVLRWGFKVQDSGTEASVGVCLWVTLCVRAQLAPESRRQARGRRAGYFMDTDTSTSARYCGRMLWWILLTSDTFVRRMQLFNVLNMYF